jgi:hypothetical protein
MTWMMKNTDVLLHTISTIQLDMEDTTVSSELQRQIELASLREQDSYCFYKVKI